MFSRTTSRRTASQTRLRPTLTHRLIGVAALAAILGGVGVSAAEATSRYNTANVYVQEQSNWCLAATAKTVIQHETGSSASQCQLIKWGKGISSCPNEAGDFYKDVASSLTRGGVVNIGYVQASPRTWAQVVDDMNADQLVMVRWAWRSGGGHALVIRGYNTSGSMLSYVNPLNSSFQSGSYNFMVNDGTHTWTNTRYGIN